MESLVYGENESPLVQVNEKVICCEHQIDEASAAGNNSQSTTDQNISAAHNDSQGSNRRDSCAFGHDRNGPYQNGDAF